MKLLRILLVIALLISLLSTGFIAQHSSVTSQIQEEQLVQQWMHDIGRAQTIYNLTYVGLELTVGTAVLNSSNLFANNELIDVPFNTSQPEFQDFMLAASNLANNENITVKFSDNFVNGSSGEPGASGSSTFPLSRVDLLPDISLNYTAIVISSESLTYVSDGFYNYLSGYIKVKFYALVDVTDNTPPQVTFSSERLNETTIVLNWTINEQYPKNYTIYVDGLISKQADLVSTDLGFIVNGNSGQTVNVTLVVFDEFNNRFAKSYPITFDAHKTSSSQNSIVSKSTGDVTPQNSTTTPEITLPAVTFPLAIFSISSVIAIREYSNRVKWNS